MNTNTNYPQRQNETEWDGDVQFFSGPALAPDDPSLEVRVRRGRPSQPPSGEEPAKDVKIDDGPQS
jgi:hypothetical protein